MASHIVVSQLKAFAACRYAMIDNPSYEFDQQFFAARTAIFNKFTSIGGSADSIRNYKLLESTHSEIVEFFDEAVDHVGRNVVFDVSVFPKRFFFPGIRRLREAFLAGRIENLVISYGIPGSYSSGRLAWNHDDWKQLPLFQGRYTRAKPERIIASLGFETLGLLAQMEEGKEMAASAVLLFPFPSGLQWAARCWDTVEKIMRVRGSESCEISCADARDISHAFDQLEMISNYGKREVVFAPYGPKPLSVAIALAASKNDYPVFYTQPRNYNPKYTKDCKMIDGRPYVMAYAIGLGGRYLY